MKHTDNFNLKMPEQTDFYNVEDFNENAEIIDAEMQTRKNAQETDASNIAELTNPAFDDSGSIEGISGFPDFLSKFKSKVNIFQWFRDFKAGAQFILHAGQIVNNCVTNNAGLPLSAAQGKVLMDLINQVNSDLSLGAFISSGDANTIKNTSHITIGDGSTWTNIPVAASGVLDTQACGVYVIQQYTTITKLSRYWRFSTDNGSTWRAWSSGVVQNSDLAIKHYDAPKPSNTEVLTFGTVWSFNALKSGNVITLRINIDGSAKADNSEQKIATIPEDYRPMFSILQNYITQGGQNMLISIRNSGDVVLNNLSGVDTTGGWLCRQCITYIVNSS